MTVLTNLCIAYMALSTFASQCHDYQHCSDCQSSSGQCISECDAGYYDQRCKSVCSKNCRSNTCVMSNTGSDNCTEGCVPGYQGTSCNTPCDNPGGTCTACPGGRDGGYCQLSSSCVSGCVDAYYGTDCKTCSSGCKSCNMTTGVCTECHPPYDGPNCEFSCEHCQGGSCHLACFQRCTAWFYGLFCSKRCSDTCLSHATQSPMVNPSVCNWTTGECVHGCKAGWYGPRCSSQCNTKCINATCTKTGDCEEGCDSGYFGRRCKSCPVNCADLNCYYNNGSCENGCTPGFYGEYCNTTCVNAVAEVIDMKVEGMTNITVSDNETVTFRCVVQGCPPPGVFLVHAGNNTPAIDRKNNTVYERAVRISSCSQLGRYYCRGTNSTGTDEQLNAVELLAIPRKRDVKDCEIETPNDAKAPSGRITFTLCAFPEPVVTKLHFERHETPKDITNNNKYSLAMKSIGNTFQYTLTIANISDEDFGAYTFSFAYGERDVDILIIASHPKEITDMTFTSIAIIIASSLVGVPLVFAAVACLVRRKTVRDYWHTKFVQPYITPTHESTSESRVSPDNIDAQIYEVIGDSCV